MIELHKILILYLQIYYVNALNNLLIMITSIFEVI